jgi:hypothetical protein
MKQTIDIVLSLSSGVVEWSSRRAGHKILSPCSDVLWKIFPFSSPLACLDLAGLTGRPEWQVKNFIV